MSFRPSESTVRLWDLVPLARRLVFIHKLVRFTRHAKLLGNGLAVIDFGNRVGRIHTSHGAGENWHREMFVQSTSFTFGALSGAAVVKGGLALLAAFTPAGMVGLIVGGAAIAAGGAVAGYAVDSSVKSRAGEWYDAIMEWLG